MDITFSIPISNECEFFATREFLSPAFGVVSILSFGSSNRCYWHLICLFVCLKTGHIALLVCIPHHLLLALS
jgi:hypothetical protein